MAQLNSPGVTVTVVDESFYTPAAPSTVPLIVIATEENKPNGANTGIAPGTLKANAGLAYLITSQRDLSETFGIASFKTDANNNPIHAGEQNEYGLHAAYSYLGVSNRAYVVRADIDLGSINAKAEAPEAPAENGTHWLDIANSNWGIFEWNGDAKGTGNGQTFIKKIPIVITNPSKVVDYANSDYTPKSSVGTIGDYAVVSLMNLDTSYDEADTIWFKSPGNAPWNSVQAGQWVKVGSQEWEESWPVAVSTLANISAADTEVLTFNAFGSSAVENLTISGTDATTIANQINSFSTYVKASVTKNGRLAIHLVDSRTSTVLSGSAVALLGLPATPLNEPAFYVQPHTKVPAYKSTDTYPRPTGSLWIKSTAPNGGMNLVMKKYNSDSASWESVATPVHADGKEAILQMDKGGGINLPVGTLFCQFNVTEERRTPFVLGTPLMPRNSDLKFYRRRASGATTVQSVKIDTVFQSNNGSYADFNIIETTTTGTKTVNILYQLLGNADDADGIAGAVNNAGLENTVASVDVQNRVILTHKLGGELRLIDNSGFGFLNDFFGAEVNPNLYPGPAATNVDFLVTLWEPLRFTASAEAPTSLTKDGTLWYNSLVDEVDIMVHNGTKWVGYKQLYAATDTNGPLVSATAPAKQSDGSTDPVDNDLWIDTSDIDLYPRIYRFDNSKPGPIPTRWVLIDNTDQSSEEGILFADARWNTTGEGKDPSTIAQLLLNDHVDPDCPDPALYPKGMLLWNMRRSGFNVKKFVQNYIDNNARNPRITLIDNNGDRYNPIMQNYYPHRWVTVSGNQQNGAGNFGRLAQRRVVVEALQAVINSSKDIREEARVFNLSACPGYPELIGELINLNFDRGLTAFIVGDTPSRLTPDATSLKNWGDNLRLSLEDNDVGAASYDEYMGMFYPWGFTSDNFGRNVVVPPSHMMLRTIALSDSVSFPWFAPAGTRRGGVTNASAVGYVDKEGEFVTVALNTGQRDTLYDVKINPITFFTGVGLVNFGQKTRAKAASALDRINVARLVVYLRRQLDILAKPYIFEPNDKITRDELKGAVESLMLELVGQRALYDYIVVCDESNNTPSRIDKNELWVDIAIEPVKAVEFIYIPLRLKNTGEIGQL